MSYLTDLFNPYFLLFLGTLLLVVVSVVYYFESKSRDQNHKIASMLSLVSTLAEDVNNVKMQINYLLTTASVGGTNYQPLEQQNNNFIFKEEKKLIEVSDDESTINDDLTEDEDDITDLSDDELFDEKYNNNDVKILKLNICKETNTKNCDVSGEEICDLEDFDETLSETISLSSKNYNLSSGFVEDVLSLHYETNINDICEEKIENSNVFDSSLKTININLEEVNSETPHDYKKLPLNKLRTIVSEKGLSLDATKMKKQEILKLLED